MTDCTIFFLFVIFIDMDLLILSRDCQAIKIYVHAIFRAFHKRLSEAFSHMNSIWIL